MVVLLRMSDRREVDELVPEMLAEDDDAKIAAIAVTRNVESLAPARFQVGRLVTVSPSASRSES